MEMDKLPEGCISCILSFTSPEEACRLSAVSRTFLSAAASNIVWERFLPSNYRELLSQSSLYSQSSSSLNSPSMKELYFRLCHHPVLIGSGNMSFALEKCSGKKIYMVGARDLTISEDMDHHWQWISHPKSRFGEVAELKSVRMLNIEGKIDSAILSSKTSYVVYFVFSFTGSSRGFRQRPVTVSISSQRSGRQRMGAPRVNSASSNSEVGGYRSVFLDPSADMPQLSQERDDGWKEIEIGEFFNEGGDDGFVICHVQEVSNYIIKSGLVVEGIEIRPKEFGIRKNFSMLPIEPISRIISFTSPRDACRLSVVSSKFKAAADSDVVWGRFLPLDTREIFDRLISSSVPRTNILLKKDLYFWLNPIKYEGNVHWKVDKATRKIRCSLGARGLTILWGDDPFYWKWTSELNSVNCPPPQMEYLSLYHPTQSLSTSKFRATEVACLKYVFCLDIRGEVEAASLSKDTMYTAFLVYTINGDSCGLAGKMKTSISVFRVQGGAKEGVEVIEGSGYLRQSTNRVDLSTGTRVPRERADGWKELQLGEFYVGIRADFTVETRLWKTEDLDLKSGLIVGGMELRPRPT